MARHRARELPRSPQHLPKYETPDPQRVRHDLIWRRALARGGHGTRATVRFPSGR